MPSKADARWQGIVHVLVSLFLAWGLWYMVVGSDQVEGYFDMRLEYRSLPEGLVVREGLVTKVSVGLRGSAALMRGLYARDLSYGVDLSDVQRGANVKTLEVGKLPEFRAFEVVDVNPPRLLLEVEAIMEASVPLDLTVKPLLEDSPLRLTYFLPEPAYVHIRGPESVVSQIKSLPITFDPGSNLQEGTRVISVAIAAPDMVAVTPPVTTLRYTLSLRTQEVEMSRVVQLSAPDRSEYSSSPDKVTLRVEVPEARVDDAAYLAAIRVVVRPGGLAPGESTEFAALVMLPEGARLSSIEPSLVTVTRRSEERLAPDASREQDRDEPSGTESPGADAGSAG